MLKIDWDADMPSEEDVQRMWNEVRFEERPITSPVLLELVVRLKALARNGDARLWCFYAAPHPTFDWFMSRKHFEGLNFYYRFLTNPQIIRATGFEVIADNVRELNNPHRYSNSMHSTLSLDGDIAQLLTGFGAYTCHEDHDPVEAKRFAASCCEAIFGQRYYESEYYVLGNCWATFFCGIAWDGTYFIIDRGQRLIWLMCLTDTD